MARKDDTGIDQRIWDYVASEPLKDFKFEVVPMTQDQMDRMMERVKLYTAEWEAEQSTKH